MKTKAFRKFLGTLAVLAIALGAGSALRVFAGTGESGSGFAWGGGVTSNPVGYDGAGWISMNSTSDGSAMSYGVSIPAANGDLSGYGWSEHYGWISFNTGDLSGCPSGTCSARRVGNAIAGWARILSIKDALAVGNSGGWSGWIQLDPPNGGVAITGSSSPYPLSGYAYSDELGWFNFDKESGFGGTNYTTPSSLKLCANSCASATPYDTAHLASFSVVPVTLTACLGTGSCSGDDTAVSGTWAANNTPNDAVSISSTSGTSTTITGTYAGSGSASEDITFSDGTHPDITARATVSCVPTTTCTTEAKNYCSGQAFTIANNGCNQSPSCTGTRNCDTNWHEVAP
jgi:hypothetical protein